MEVQLRCKPRTRRSTCLLAILLSVMGCGSDRQQELPDPSSDSARAVQPSEIDTSSAAPPQSSDAALRGALQHLLGGESHAASGQSWFSAATAGALRTVTIDSTGHAVVNFEDLQALIPNASSSAGSASLLEDLNAAVFSIDAVRSVEYQIEGSCERFWNWLQFGCRTVVRPG